MELLEVQGSVHFTVKVCEPFLICDGFVCFQVTFAIFALYTSLSEENLLTPDKAFVTMALVNTLQLPLQFLPYSVTFCGQVC
jgi:hypothetical protein